MENKKQEESLFNEETTADIKGSNMVKDPDNWTTGDEPMTGAQHSYLETLSAEAGEEMDETLNKAEAGEEMDETLNKAEASKRIDELQHQTGRGVDK